MHRVLLPLLTSLALSGCDKTATQADALENAAAQSDPAAAAELREQARAIRNGSEADLSAPGSPAQSALQSAGNLAAEDRNPHNNQRH
jgi:uncharacterized protein YceK